METRGGVLLHHEDEAPRLSLGAAGAARLRRGREVALAIVLGEAGPAACGRLSDRDGTGIAHRLLGYRGSGRIDVVAAIAEVCAGTAAS